MRTILLVRWLHISAILCTAVAVLHSPQARTIPTSAEGFTVKEAAVHLHPNAADTCGDDILRPCPVVRDLTTLANEASSDKGSAYACAHWYTRVYERVLAPLAAREHFRMLEIGLNRDSALSTPSLEMWRQYFGDRVELHGVDIDPAFAAFHAPLARGVHIHIADQANDAHMRALAASLGPLSLDLVVDDGFHASRHQQVSLAALWPTIAPGGMYVIEDLHYQPAGDEGTKTRQLLHAWKAGVPLASPYTNASLVSAEAASIDFYDSLSAKWPAEALRDALVIIRKKAA